MTDLAEPRELIRRALIDLSKLAESHGLHWSLVSEPTTRRRRDPDDCPDCAHRDLLSIRVYVPPVPPVRLEPRELSDDSELSHLRGGSR